jgi:WhiB family redox-sensing transcriptional regulator
VEHLDDSRCPEHPDAGFVYGLGPFQSPTLTDDELVAERSMRVLLARLEASMAGIDLTALERLAAHHWTPWRADAACAGIDDPDQFFPERGDSLDAPRAVCRRCEVAGPCLAFAIETGEQHGVWGGTSERERRHLRRLVTATDDDSASLRRSVALRAGLDVVLADQLEGRTIHDLERHAAAVAAVAQDLRDTSPVASDDGTCSAAVVALERRESRPPGGHDGTAHR